MRTRAAFLLALLLLAARAQAGGGPCDVLVVVNARDPDSVRIGEHYRAVRGVPAVNLLRLSVPPSLGTGLGTYKRSIEEPIKDHLARTGIGKHVEYIVLTRGLPIVVQLRKGVVSTAAALMVMDTSISGMPQRPVPIGPFRNLYRAGNRGFLRAKGQGGGTKLYLVTFLTGYDAADAMALVDRAVAAEKALPEKPSFHFQDAAGGAGARNGAYAQAVERLVGLGFDAARHPHGAEAVTGLERVMGTMSGGSYSGLTEKTIRSQKFLPGAIADMLESFGAAPKNFISGQQVQVPVPWFIRHGITGIHGAVAEPYAHTFPDALLFERYARGMNLAESFHASIPFLYWMNLVIGDPLCTPFRERPRVTIEGLPEEPAEGVVELAVASRGGRVTESIVVWVDGREAGRVAGAGGRVRIDTRTLSNGPHEVLVTATLDGALGVEGWTRCELTVANEEVAVLSASSDRDGWIRVELNRPLPDGGTLAATVDGKPAEVRPDTGRRILRLVPSSPPPRGRRVSVTIAGAFAAEVAVITPPAALRVEVPDLLVAGHPGMLRVTALDEKGRPAEEFRGHLTAGLTSPPVTGAEIPADSPKVESTVTLLLAGEHVLRVRDRISGARGEARVRVRPGLPRSLELSPAALPVGRPTEVTVALLDLLGNPVRDYEGKVRLLVPGDPRARTGDVVEASGGKAVFPGVTVFQRGNVPVQLARASGMPFARGVVRAVVGAEREWLLVPGFPADPSAELLAARPTEDGVLGDARWRSVRSDKDGIDTTWLLGKGRGTDGAHLYFQLAEKGTVTLRIGWRPRIAVYVDGREVFRAPKPMKQVRADAETVALPDLAPGWHRLLVVVPRRGEGPAFRLRFADAEGGPVEGLRVSLSDPE